jgi:uridine kinase
MATQARIIAICGMKRSGKDTLANIISEHYTYEHVKISKKLKDTCKLLFNFTDDQMEKDIKEEIDPRWGVSPRKCMQYFGTELMQYQIQNLLNIGKKFWINSLLNEIDVNSSSKKYVISDLRFLHEYEEIKKRNGLIICVDRVKTHSSDQGVEATEDLHISEQEYKKFDYDLIIKNDTIESMITQIQSFFDR